MTRRGDDSGQVLLGEWACLGLLVAGPSHGFAIATRLQPDGDVGRVWSLSRPLTYRALDKLHERGYVRPVAEEPGIAGGNRTILAPTRLGRSRLRTWLSSPVAHVRDLRSELLLKLVLADLCGVDCAPMLTAQHAQLQQVVHALEEQARDHPSVDVVALWRAEASAGALRFVERLLTGRTSG